jgi:replicative DNA helicase
VITVGVPAYKVTMVGDERGKGRGLVAVADDTRVAAPANGPVFDRTPPQDIEAEMSVLGGMLLSKDAIADVIEVLRGGDFYRPAHQLIYDAILDLYGRGEPADAVTVAAELSRAGQIGRVGGHPYLHTLISGVPTAANAGYYAEIVAERSILRRLVEAGTRIVQMGYGAAGGEGMAGTVDDVVDRAQAEIYEVTERRTTEDYVRIEDLLEGTLDEMDRMTANGGLGAGVPTGFAQIDEMTHGLHPGQMVVVAGRPGSGKALALDTDLATPTGWTTMGEITVGDYLMGADGKPTRVVAATDVMVGRPCYEVEFSDGTVIVADAEHQWRTTTRKLRLAAVVGAATADGALVTPSALIAELGSEFRADVLAEARTVRAAGQGTRWVKGRSSSYQSVAPTYRRADLIARLAARCGKPNAVVTTEGIARTLRAESGRPRHAVECAVAARRDVVDVRKIESVPVRCVQVDNSDRLYLAGRTMVPTHNSTLAMDFARSAAIKNHHPTVIFSLEMSKQDIMMRLFSAEARVKLNDIRSGRMTDDDWRKIALRSSELAEAPLFIDDSPNLTMMEIRAKSRRLKQRNDLKLIVIDYMQLMTSGKRVESRQQEVSEFSRAMKLLAKELEVPVVALSQLNRGPEQRTDKKPMLSDLRESGSIEQDADLVLLVHREDMYERESPRAGEADIIIAKHRNGPTGQATVAFQGLLSRFVDMTS